MDKETSTYLDCARFLAAFIVMFCHVDNYMVTGVMPFVDHLGLEAVGVFFVLSGFVIGYATEFREKDLRTYAINRSARLYSVVIPCLTITFITDRVGIHLFPGIYFITESFFREAIHIVIGFTFLSYSWLLPHALPPGRDSPFWSLCCEVPYYVVFGAIWYLRGYLRWLVPILTIALFGPVAFSYFPLWLAGLGLYYLVRKIHLKPLPARGVLALSMLLWLGFEAMLKYFDLCLTVQADITSARMLVYGAGLCFLPSVLGFRFAGLSLARIAGPARWLAGATFTLYLLHYPLAWFLHGVILASPLGNAPAILRFALLIAVILALALALAQVTERRKDGWRRGIDRIFMVVERMFVPRARLRPKEQN